MSGYSDNPVLTVVTAEDPSASGSSIGVKHTMPSEPALEKDHTIADPSSSSRLVENDMAGCMKPGEQSVSGTQSGYHTDSGYSHGHGGSRPQS